MFLKLYQDQFCDVKDAFKRNVKRVDIENYNICNRRCKMCPQSLKIRDNGLQIFEENLYIKLMQELKESAFSGTIAIGRYHEPLLLFSLTLARIVLAKQIVSEANIIINTNGDLMTKQMLFELSMVGVDEIKIMRYQDNEYSTEEGIRLCTAISEVLGRNIIRQNIIENENCYMQLENEGNLKISVRSENYYSSRGNNRGGLIKELNKNIRNKACFVTKHSIDIDYNGDVLPCCNMISDAQSHKQYIIGNINNESIYDLYWKSCYSDFTKSIQKADFRNIKTCQYCTYDY